MEASYIIDLTTDMDGYILSPRDDTYNDPHDAPRASKKRKIDATHLDEPENRPQAVNFRETMSSNNLTDCLMGHEKKVEKEDHNLIFADGVKTFLATHHTEDMSCTVVYLDAEHARTTCTLAKKLSPDQMLKVCAITLEKETFEKMQDTIDNEGIDCMVHRENIWYTFHGKYGLQNDGKPICVYLDFCGMWRKPTQKIFNNVMRWYCFDGSICAVTLCLSKRQPHLSSDPDEILDQMNQIAQKHSRTLDIVHQTVYGKSPTKMLFVMFKVI